NTWRFCPKLKFGLKAKTRFNELKTIYSQINLTLAKRCEIYFLAQNLRSIGYILSHVGVQYFAPLLLCFN
ncbi:MAG: hypothetical protein SAK29_36455, partial [Scytonema sp. PMC 1069.18]|nr:hypothetical protein [Scytonema sp. PMC 1069.18]